MLDINPSPLLNTTTPCAAMGWCRIIKQENLVTKNAPLQKVYPQSKMPFCEKKGKKIGIDGIKKNKNLSLITKVNSKYLLICEIWGHLLCKIRSRLSCSSALRALDHLALVSSNIILEEKTEHFNHIRQTKYNWFWLTCLDKSSPTDL